MWRTLISENKQELVRQLRWAGHDVVEEPNDPDPEHIPGEGIALGAWRTHMASAIRSQSNAGPLLDLLSDLGQGHYDVRPTTLWDIRRGPLALLEAGTSTPTLAVCLGREWLDDQRADDRERQLQFIVEDLARAFDVRLVGSGSTIRRVLDVHAGVIPASAVNETSGRHDDARIGTATNNNVDDYLPDPEDDAWVVLATIADEPAERRPMREIRGDPMFGNVTRTAHDHRVKRLEDADLVERVEVNGERHERLLPAGQQALDEYRELYHSPLRARDSDARAAREGGADAAGSPESPSPSAAGSTGYTGEGRSDAGGGQSGGVSDPPKPPDGAVYNPTRGREGGTGSRPAAEGLAVSGGGSRDVPRRRGTGRWLALHQHHGIAGAAAGSDLSLVDADAELLEHPGDRGFSYDADRDEIVVEAEWSDRVAHVGVRLAAALTDPRLMREVIPPERLEGDEGALEALLDGNAFLLRKGPCLGWLSDEDLHGQRYRQRLEDAGKGLLAASAELSDEDGEYRRDVAQDVLRGAHGLISTMTWIYRLVGVDVIRHLRLPNHRRDGSDTRIQNLRQFLATASYLSSSYKAYNAYRVLVESREEKREDGLVRPAVDPEDPTGEHMGSWVLTGPGIGEEISVLEGFADDRELHPDPIDDDRTFKVDLEIQQGHRRQTVASTMSRLSRFSGLKPTPEAVSTMLAFVDSPQDVATALSSLGSEEFARRIELHEVRYALSSLEQSRILPSADREGTLGAVVATLLATETPISTAKLVTRAGLTTETLRRQADRLEAFGLVERDDGGPGRPTHWRLRLPFREERRDRDGPTPRYLHGVNDPPKLTEGVIWQEIDRPPPVDPVPVDLIAWRVADALEDALGELGESIIWHEPDLWEQLRLGGPGGASLDDVLLDDRWRWVRPWLDTLSALIGRDVGPPIGSWDSGPTSTVEQLGRPLEKRQALLTRWTEETGGAAAAD